MGNVGQGSWARRVVVLVVSVVVGAGAVAVTAPRALAVPQQTDDQADLAEPEALGLDRDQSAMAEAVDEAETIAEAEAASREVTLPPGALDGTAGPDLFGEQDPSILRPSEDGGAVYPGGRRRGRLGGGGAG